MSLAILCSGQGLQHPGMFALTGDAPEAADLFVQATALLDGHDPRELVSSLSAAALHENRIGQFLCTIQALAAKAALCDVWLNNFLVAGYSVGEVAAWGVAGLTSPSTTLELIRRRADAMDAAKSPDEGLLSVRGLSRDTIQKLCTYRDAAISIVNPDDAFVIGGTDEALHAIASDARNLGASRIVRVAVNVAFHTARLSAASEEFRKVLLQTPIKKPGAGARLFSGIDGQAVLDISAGIEKLATQISHTVQWAACLESCVEAGASAFLELGPGRRSVKWWQRRIRTFPREALKTSRHCRGYASGWIVRDHRARRSRCLPLRRQFSFRPLNVRPAQQQVRGQAQWNFRRPARNQRRHGQLIEQRAGWLAQQHSQSMDRSLKRALQRRARLRLAAHRDCWSGVDEPALRDSQFFNRWHDIALAMVNRRGKPSHESRQNVDRPTLSGKFCRLSHARRLRTQQRERVVVMALSQRNVARLAEVSQIGVWRSGAKWLIHSSSRRWP